MAKKKKKKNERNGLSGMDLNQGFLPARQNLGGKGS